MGLPALSFRPFMAILYFSVMPSCGRSGKKERRLSLIQVDAGREWRGGQRQSLLLAREIYKRGYPLCFVVQPNSPLYKKAGEENIPVTPVRMRNEIDIPAALRLAWVMKRATTPSPAQTR